MAQVTLNNSNKDYFKSKLSELLIDFVENETVTSPFVNEQSFLDIITQGLEEIDSLAQSESTTFDLDELVQAGFSRSELLAGSEPNSDKEVLAAPRIRPIRVRPRRTPGLGPTVPARRPGTPAAPSGTSPVTPSPGASARAKKNIFNSISQSSKKFFSRHGWMAMTLWPVIKGIFDSIVGWFKNNWNNIVDQVTEPSFLREVILDYNAYRRIQDSMESEMYAPSAYEHILETKGARGYGGQQASQGAYDMPSAELKSDFKKFIPDSVGTSRYKDPDIQNALRQNTSSKNKNTKFVKISQATSEPVSAAKPEPTEESKKSIEQLQNLMPKWSVTDILNQIKPIADDPKMSVAEKQRAVVTIVNKYSSSATALYNFLKQNYNLPDVA
jgi:hypothetical protein